MKPFVEKCAEKGFLLSAVFSASITIFILSFMLFFSLPLFKGDDITRFFTLGWNPYEGKFGILPMMAGTGIIASLALFIATPFGIGCSALISVFSNGSFGRFLRKVVEFMTGIPTVIYGFVAIFLLVPFIREIFEKGTGMCVLSASIMLALLILPTIVLFLSDAFNSVPKSYIDAADSLGATPAQKLVYVIIPYAWKGMVSGLVLAAGRAVGDTLIALMIAGNALQIPTGLDDAARTLTSHIALIIASDYESPEFKSIFLCGLILFAFTAVIVLIMRSLGHFKILGKR
ncbi:MAG: phosphate ABC transporter permease subunit PstC [Deltaproteobacteria bacterium]|nr:phosphate ABC transporter permease subunit PstC [Deltaproteobacteria bacterium]